MSNEHELAAETVPAEEPTTGDTSAGDTAADAPETSHDENVGKADNVVLTKPCFSPDALTENNERLAILNVTLSQLDEQLKRYPSSDFAKGEEGRRWAQNITDGAPHVMSGGSYDASVADQSRLWMQGVDHDGVDLVAKRPRLGEGDGSGKLSGERALLRVAAATGLGAVVQVPLWYSGIWVTLKAPGDDELLELDRRIGQEKIKLGRDTSGMIFSNESVYITSMLVNFALRRVYDASVKDITLSNLKSIIRVNDIPTLIWGLLCTIYPNGYPLARPCTVEPAKCQHVVKETLNITKLLWVDNRGLNEKQRKHMSRRSTAFADTEITTYQDAHVRGSDKMLKINDVIKLVLRVPTLQQYEDAGYSWVEGIVQMVDGAFDVPLRGQERDAYISEQARLSVMRQYAHWVDKLILGDEEIIDDPETLEDIMNRWSSDEEITTTFIRRVGEFIDESCVSMVAIPRYDCPNCGQPSGVDHKHPHLIPLEVTRVFFTLIHQRLMRKLRPVRL